MEVTNIFMNSYQQPENKLAYNLLCLIEHMEQPKAFCAFLLGNEKSLSNNPLTELKTVFSGGESNPDGMIRLQSQDKTEYRVYMENKTLRNPLVDTQLRNHLSKFCEDDDSFLLVTTPRISDIKIIDKINVIRLFSKHGLKLRPD